MQRLLKLSLMSETDIFSPQARDSRIMCESWQVYYYAYMFRLKLSICEKKYEYFIRHQWAADVHFH